MNISERCNDLRSTRFKRSARSLLMGVMAATAAHASDVIKPDAFFANPAAPNMTESARAYSLHNGFSADFINGLRLPKLWEIGGGLPSSSRPLTIDFSDNRLFFSSPGQVTLCLGAYLSPFRSYRLSFTMSGPGAVRAGFQTAPLAGARALSKLIEFRAEPGASRRIETVLDPTADAGQRFLVVLFVLSGQLELRDFRLEQQAETPGETFAEGELLEVSKLPEPKKADYPDCYFTAKVRLHHILAGTPVPQEMQLIIPGFRQRKATQYASWKRGDRIRVKLVKFDTLDDKTKSVQQADDLAIYDLENSFVCDGVVISRYTDYPHPIGFSGPAYYRSPWDFPVNAPVAAAARADQAACIKRDLAELNALLANRKNKTVEFEHSIAACLKSLSGKDILEYNGRKYWWKNCNGSFFAIPTNYKVMPPRSIARKNLQALQSLRDFLEVNGVQLVIQVIPDHHDIAARIMVPGGAGIPDYQSAECTKELLEAGIEAMYSAGDLIRNYKNNELMYCYPGNEHPHDGVQDCLTSAVTERLRRYDTEIKRARTAAILTVVRRPDETGRTILNWPAGVDIGHHLAGEPISHLEVLADGNTLCSNPTSPILVIGNSHIQTPLKDLGYTTHLALKTQVIAHDFRISSFGPLVSIPMELFKNPNRYLKGKKVCIYPVQYTFLVTGMHYLDLREADRNFKLLNGKTSCVVWTGDWSGQTPIPAMAEFAAQKKAFPNEPGIFLAKTGTLVWGRKVLPDQLRGKPLVLEMDVVPSARKEIHISVNGQKKEIPLSNTGQEKYQLFWEFDGSVDVFDFTVECTNSPAALLIPAVKIYQ